MSAKTVTIFHNPNCSTSRRALAMVRDAGAEVTVVEYLKTGWTREMLDDLLGRMQARPRDILRTKEALATSLGLSSPGASDETLLQAMIEHPVLVERPIVVSQKGAAVCRPVERLSDLI